MRKLMIVAGLTLASNSAFAADPSSADCQFSGVVGMYSHYGELSGDGSGTGEGFAGFGKINTCDFFGTGINVQTDIYGETDNLRARYVVGGPALDNTSRALGEVSHYYYRNQDLAFGVLSGTSLLSNNSQKGGGTDFLSVLGLDGQVYFERMTLTAQFAYWNSFGKTKDWQIDDAYQVAGEARYFAADDLKLIAHATYQGSGSTGGRWPLTALTVGGGAEYKFEQTPISVFADYSHVMGKLDGGLGADKDVNSDLFSVGFALHFGQGTLLSEDRTSASFATPMIDNWTNISPALYRTD